MIIDVDPRQDPDRWRIARNVAVTDARLSRIAASYADATTDLPQVVAWAEQWRAEPTSASWLYLAGPVGTGKTHAAIAALRLAVQVPRAVPWEFTTMTGFLESLRPGGPPDAEQRYQAADLLIIDDIGMVKTNSEWAIETLYRVIDYRRRNNRCVIVTSNQAPGGLSQQLNEQIVSRIAQHCTAVALTGADRRRTRAGA